MSAALKTVPQALRRAKPPLPGDADSAVKLKVTAVKHVECRDFQTAQDVRHELRALDIVAEQKLPFCMPGRGAYASRLNPTGGIEYHLAMPCAPSLLDCR